MLALTWLGGLLRRRGSRLAGTALGVALAVGLLGALGAFVAHAKGTMTGRAAANVVVDWQVEAQPGADAAQVLATTRASNGVRALVPVNFAPTTGLHATIAGTTQSTGPGQVVGLQPEYATTFPGALRPLAGNTTGVLLAQQTAANLHAGPGDTIAIGRAGLPDATLRVDGIVDMPIADSFFQKVGAPPGAQAQAPPDNVLFLPADQWRMTFDPLKATRPDLIRHQGHVRLARQLPRDPAAAFSAVTGAAHNLEARLTGAGLVGNNLGAALDAARKDAAYSQVLFVLLGLPGAVLAGLLAHTVAGAGRARRRREMALLRARGAAVGVLGRLALAEAGAVAAAGSIAGLVLAAAVGAVAFHSATFGTTTAAAIGWAAAAVVIGSGIAVAAVVLPARQDARATTVAAGRATVGRTKRSLALRWGVDIWLLAASAVVFWASSRGGYALVLAPEGVPSVSVSYWALAGPVLLWLGGGLAGWRLAESLLRQDGALRRAVRPIAGSLSGPVAATLRRQRRLLAQAVVLVALTVAFALSTSVFNATYRHQVGVDARLTNGADVTVTAPASAPLPATAVAAVHRVAGVRQVEAVQHRFVYVGTDLQDLFGVNPRTVAQATSLQDAYFAGGTARELMAKLARQPDALLVSAETAKDFQLHAGDRLQLRVRDARTGEARPVQFHFAGVAKEFPTAPRDSFLIANAAYVATQTGDPTSQLLLVDTAATAPPVVARRVRAIVGPNATVSDIDTSRRVVGSALTAVDLGGLTRVELGLALLLGAATTGLVLALGLAERRRALAIAAALGARPRQLGAFIRSEAAAVLSIGLGSGVIVGWLLAQMLVKVLTGVFDPPPSALAVPWTYLGGFTVVVIAATVVASEATLRAARRPAVELIRDL